MGADVLAHGKAGNIRAGDRQRIDVRTSRTARKCTRQLIAITEDVVEAEAALVGLCSASSAW